MRGRRRRRSTTGNDILYSGNHYSVEANGEPSNEPPRQEEAPYDGAPGPTGSPAARPDPFNAGTAELRHSEKSIEELRADYVDLYDFAPVGYITFDSEGFVIDVNRVAAGLLGFRRSEILGRDFAIFVEDRSQAKFSLHLRKILASERREACEFGVTRKTGRTFCARFESNQTRCAGRTAVRTVISDIMARKRVEKQKDELIRQLREALAEIKTLQGLLPICVYCKKIRTSDGRWEQIEAYLTDRLEVQFSHAYCPECMTAMHAVRCKK